MTHPQAERSSFPAPIYRATVLARVFADAQRYFLDPLLAVHYAHTLMLAKQGILTLQQSASCLHGLDALDLEAIRTAPYDGSCEDLFFFVERELAAFCGADNAGRMHTARSRNDIDLTMYRMVLRDLLLGSVAALHNLRHVLLDLATRHRTSLMPAYTHNQPAQPTTLGHYLMAVTECLERDTARLQAAYRRVNLCPLGACAITTTGFPIDRHHTAALLGFDALQVNSYGAIAAVDYLTESCSVLAVAMLNLGRFAQDLLLWSTAEFRYLRLSDGYVQISSIMPQKRNPVPLEHVRILASRAMTQSQAILGSLHNTPFADMNDAEDDLQPLVYTAFEDGLRALALLTGALAEAEFDTAHMAAAASGSFLTVTELADTLVRETGISFRIAHEIVSSAVLELAGAYDAERMAAHVERLLAEHPGYPAADPALLRRSLDAAHFIAVRQIPGGPAPQALDPELHRARTQLHDDETWLTASRQSLAAVAARRKDEQAGVIASLADQTLVTRRSAGMPPPRPA